MSENGDSRRYAIPDFGDMVARTRIVGLFQRVRPSLCVIAAPAAYGKSVLAAQLSSPPRFSGALWVRPQTRGGSAANIVSAALAALSASPLSLESEYIALERDEPLQDLCLRLDDAVHRLSGHNTCLVLDNLSMPDSGALDEMADAVRRCRSIVCCVVVIRATVPLPRLPLDALSVCSEDLLLDMQEAEQVARAVMGGIPDRGVLQSLMDASGCQPGLLSLVARNVASHVGGWTSATLARADMTELVAGLADSQLDSERRFTLECMAALGEGTSHDLALVPGCDVSPDALREIAAAVPMVRVRSGLAETTFVVHDLAQRAFGDGESLLRKSGNALDALADALNARGDWNRLLRLVLESGDAERLRHWLSAVGVRALRQGNEELLQSALARLDAVHFVSQPRLLLLRAAVMREMGQVEQACRDAQIARELAEQDADAMVLANALLILAEVASGRGDYALALAYLEGAIESRDSRVSSDTLATLCGRRLMMTTLYCDAQRVEHAERVLAGVSAGADGDTTRHDAMRSFFLGTVRGCYWGDWAAAAPLLDTARRCPSLPTSLRLAASYNYVGALTELARIAEAERALAEYEDSARAAGDRRWSIATDALRALLRITNGECEDAFAEIACAARAEWEANERLSATTTLLSGSTALLGYGRWDEATAMSELALAYSSDSGTDLLQCLARLGVAACRVAAYDVSAAVVMVADVQKRLASAQTNYVLLQAALIRAQADLLCGRAAEAANHLAPLTDYMSSESPNWLLAMYIRAFPQLLGVVALSLGVDRIPSRVLRLLPPSAGHQGLDLAGALLSRQDRAALSTRLRQCQGITHSRSEDAPPPAVCRVRLFGGLRVEVDGRFVEDKSWRKRKARLLFAMMTARCGKDIPRDQLIEYLWPDMNEQQALNNFYVAWSCMKHALIPDLRRGDVCAFVEHRGGVCRTAAGGVETDVDKFDALLSAAAKARSQGDEASELTALQAAADLYRGEVLPGEAYDDWFSALRERCRHDFEDAMLRAANLLEARADVGGALSLLRRALQHDPWREDLYQASLRLQMAAGQRSAAIETYLACRTRLVEDLGIDPSGETMRLYEQVLGMEECSGTVDYSVGGCSRGRGAEPDG
jgi:DNA-binding SARP family transcriptional activator/ATP/maltotriose-dependent transcriptional regulator MalT